MTKTHTFRHLDLFSGIGGFALAASWVWGEHHELISFCEHDPDCWPVLNRSWPGVPIHTDVKRFKQQKSISKHRGYDYGKVSILTGGFPCQPYSSAGHKRGKDDDRALWPEMARIIKETKPDWIIGENVAGFTNMGLDDCLSDMESQGYETRPFVIPACGVQAIHKRDRVWIVANSKGFRRDEKSTPEPIKYKEPKGPVRGCCGIAPNPTFTRLEGWLKEASKQNPDRVPERQDSPHRRFQIPKPSICRGYDGLSSKAHRTMLGQLGNAIVPQVVMVIMACIREIEETQMEMSG